MLELSLARLKVRVESSTVLEASNRRILLRNEFTSLSCGDKQALMFCFTKGVLCHRIASVINIHVLCLVSFTLQDLPTRSRIPYCSSIGSGFVFSRALLIWSKEKKARSKKKFGWSCRLACYT